MNKAIKILISIIVVLSIFCILTPVYAAFEDNTYASDRTVIYATNGVPQRVSNGSVHELFMLSGGKIQQGNNYSVLYMPHVYCAEHGAQLHRSKWKAKGEYTVEDPVLAYILNNGPEMGKMESSYKSEASQLALWYYLKNTNTTDRNIITENGEVQQHESHVDQGTLICCKYISQKNNLYKKAEDYASQLYTKPTLELKLVGNNLKINVGGYFEKFDIIINGNNYGNTRTKLISNSYEESINISDFNTSEISVQIKAIKKVYTAKYYVLKHVTSSYQTMMVVTGVGEGETTVDSEIKKETVSTNVSLQKYISKVTDSNGKVKYESEVRKNKYADTNANLGISSSAYKHAEVNVSKNNKATGTNNYKIKNPVEIAAGDTVEYKVIVYNNSNIGATVDIKDTTNDIAENVDGIFKNGYIANGLYLEAGKEESYTVKVTYNTYTDDIIDNKAYISSSSPNNQKTYRTYDEDYVVMEKYEVSLEKFIKGVNINASTNIETNIYPTITSYLKNSGNITNLVENYRKINGIVNVYSIYDTLLAKNDIDADLNNDGVIDNKDVQIYKTYLASTNINMKMLENYIYADINKDGIVDNEDLDIFMVLKSNINNDGTININDIYNFELNRINELVSSKSNLVSMLRIARLKNYLETDDLSSVIDKYIKSDINNDGMVNESDAIFIDINTKITEFAYDLYDVNGDSLVDYNDIEILEKYNSDIYSKLNGIEISKIDEYIADIEKCIKNKEAYKEDFDVNADNSIDNEDLVLAKEYKSIMNNIEARKEAGVNKDSILNCIELCDIYIDGIVNDVDIEVLKIIVDKNLNGDSVLSEKYSNKDINNDGKVDEIDQAILEVISGSKEFDDVYINNSKYYDINGDNIIDEKDKELINNLASSVTSGLFEMENNIDYIYSDEFINYVEANIDSISTNNTKFDIDSNGISFEAKDLEKLNTYITYIQNNLSSRVYQIINSEYDISNLTEEAINYMNEKTHSNDFTYMDINNDGKVDDLDKNLLSNNNINTEISHEVIDKINELLTLDLNNDGKYDTTDANILKSFDINNDGEYDDIDKKLYNEIDNLITTNPDNYNSVLENLKNISNYEDTTEEREGKAEYLTESGNSYIDNTKKDGKLTQHNTYKYDNTVTVSNGDTVTYTIKVKNDGTSNVYISKITDVLPSGVICSEETKDGVQYNENNVKGAYLTDLAGTLLVPGQTASIDITIQVTEPNISLNILKNTAVISEMKNENNKVVQDQTPYNNEDSDYIQTRDITISGTVWNDKALDKAQQYYNGIYDYEGEKENALSGIKVELYRDGIGKVAKTVTNNNGQYSFSAENLTDVSNNTNNTKYIKASRNTDNTRWNDSKEYYSYYVIFEYDGITYTSTIFEDITSDNAYDSNAKEDNEIVSITRKDFNKKFSTINNESGIDYDTVNDDGYIPQSNHKYDSSTMAIQSSTNKIVLSNNAALEKQLQHVNLGLRGRDIFDLELKTDVYSTKVTVNGVQGLYQYGNNEVTLRKEDISVAEDAANLAKETIESTVSNVNQGIRKKDIKNDAYDVDNDGVKGDTGLKIEVTYKMIVQNVSKTDGAVTKVTDYYDQKYNFIKAYTCDNEMKIDYEMTIDNGKAVNGSTGNGYKSVTLTTQGTNLTQNHYTEIYLVFELINPSETLKALTEADEQSLATFNIAEITEYTTKCNETNGQTEYTRGLLDKDSAPGSINKEQVRLTTTVRQNTATTLTYYFDGAMEYLEDKTSRVLNFLKYEDDTYAAPILYFVSPKDPDSGDDTTPDYRRTITGIVFEDKTTTDSETKVKTGDGVLGENEVGIFGATVELVEINTNKSPKDISETEGTVRFTTTTDKNGRFVIRNFLPGSYIIRYRYGNTTSTVLLHQSGELNINSQSYNGEDYQSTNNTGNYIKNKLNETINYWYVFNEKDCISTATDNSARRLEVSQAVTIFTDEQMTVLNNMRDGKDKDGAKITYQENGQNKEVTVENIINSTKMYATTPKMFFTVEQTINLDDLGNDKATLIKNKLIVEKGNNLGEWAKFPNKDDAYYKEYKIDNMNFGIAEVPVTTIGLTKTIQSFTITDSTGSNVIVSVTKNEEGNWNTRGNVIQYPGKFDVSIEDDKLQGARLQVTYTITSEIKTEKNFDNKSLTVPIIEGLVDYIDNNLSYNENLGENKKYWTITTLEEVKEDYKSMTYNNGTIPQGTVDTEGTKYTTIVRANDDNPILLTQEGKGTATITLEKILSSTDSTLEEIITSTLDTFVYNNIIEITKLDYKNYQTEDPGDDPDSDPNPNPNPDSNPDDDVLRDVVRTPDRYIILPGVQHDTAIAETITIHPPTGDSSINIIYYVMVVVSLVILAAGVFGIRKFVLKK